MSEHSRKLPSQALATRYLKAAQAAELEPRELRIEPDGTLRLIFTGGAEPASALDEWMAKREAS